MAPWSRRKKSDPAVRLFFATDVHGSDRCFRKFLAAAEAYDAKILVLGGDVAGKAIVPIRRDGDTVSAEMHGDRVTLPASEKEKLVSDINVFGFYAVEMDDAESERIGADKAYREQVFRREIRAQLEGWCELAGERLPADVRCIITPGNDDPIEIDAVLEAAEKVECPERQLCDLGPALLASIGDVTPTPWDTEREYSEEELAERIAAIVEPAPDGVPMIFNFHNPPYNSGLDTAAELDDQLRPVIRGGRPSFIPVGSKAVREAISKYQPTVGLHGHIHESRAAQKIGQTLCLNPGSDYGEDLLRGVIVDVADDGSCLDFLFTAG
jgi:Icc-related predicted phosphoesterase